MAYKPVQPGVRKGAYKRPKKRRWPVALMVAADVIAAALLLLIFYVTNYEMHGETGPIESLPVPSWMTSVSPDPGTSLLPTGTAALSSPTATLDPSNWRVKFADKFTDGEVEQTDTSYRSANISLTIEKVELENLTYFVADIYVAELKYFRTAFAKDAGKMGYEALTTTIAKENDAILAINGDYCLNNWSTGVIIRNGQPYKNKKPSADQFVMYYDGTMKSIPPEEFDYDTVVAQGAYQIWSWGPMLLDDGSAMTDFNMPDSFGGLNPRTAIGYYEPGHYCFVLVEGRQTYSDGIMLPELSQLFSGLGCTEAYNLDGGRTSEMAFFGELVNQPLADGRRECSDIIYIGE